MKITPTLKQKIFSLHRYMHVLLIGLVLWIPTHSHATFQYYIDCSVKEQTSYINVGPFERATKVTRYWVCVKGEKEMPGVQQSENAVIRGPQFDPRGLDDLACPALGNKKTALVNRIKTLENLRTDASLARTSVSEVLAIAKQARVDMEPTRAAEQSACTVAKNDLEELSQSIGLNECLGRGSRIDRAECMSDKAEANPAYVTALNTSQRKCRRADSSQATAVAADADIKNIGNELSRLDGNLREINRQLSIARVSLNRVNEARAEKSCPRQ